MIANPLSDGHYFFEFLIYVKFANLSELNLNPNWETINTWPRIT
jgi:hypothetical protein